VYRKMGAGREEPEEVQPSAGLTVVNRVALSSL
jgi:hypothetical protein